MIEANTPFQWFAPTLSSRVLGDVWDQFRDLKIDFRLGAKAEPNKAAFFQLCQRRPDDRERQSRVVFDAVVVEQTATKATAPAENRSTR